MTEAITNKRAEFLNYPAMTIHHTLSKRYYLINDTFVAILGQQHLNANIQSPNDNLLCENSINFFLSKQYLQLWSILQF